MIFCLGSQNPIIHLVLKSPCFLKAGWTDVFIRDKKYHEVAENIKCIVRSLSDSYLKPEIIKKWNENTK